MEFQSCLYSRGFRFALAIHDLQARLQLSRRTNKKTTRGVAFLFVGGGGGSLSFAGRGPAHHASLRSPTLPFGRGFNLSPIPSNAKGAAHWATPFTFGGGGGGLSLRFARQTSAPLRPPAPFRHGFSCLAGQTKRPPLGWPSCLLVEAAGVEPASASTLPLALHA